MNRRDTVLGFQVEDQELQGLFALLSQISALIANMPGIGGGQNTFTAPGRSGQSGTLPPTPNYGAPTGIAPNVSAGGRPNPAALGLGGSPFSGPGAAMPNGSALGGVGGGFSISGAVTLQISGSLTIHATGTVNFVGAGGAGAAPPSTPGTPQAGAPQGGTGGGQTPPAPQTPPTPQRPPRTPYDGFNPFGNLGTGGPGATTRFGLGMLLGHPGQFLGQGDDALRAGAGYYMGQQIGNAAVGAMQPGMNELSYVNRGLGIASSEDITAMRWRTIGHSYGAVFGGVVGGLIGKSPMAVGAGAAVGSAVIGSGADYVADQIERGKAVRIATQPLEIGMGMTPGNIRHLMRMPGGISPVPAGGTGQFSDELTATSADILGTLAPFGLESRGTLTGIADAKRRLQENYAKTVSNYLRSVASDPMAGDMITSLDASMSGRNARELFSPENASWMSGYFGTSGNMGAAVDAAAIGKGGLRTAQQGFFGTLRARSQEAEGQAFLGRARTEVQILQETRGGAAAAERLRRGDIGEQYEQLAAAKGTQALQYEQLAVTAQTPEQRRMALARAAAFRSEQQQLETGGRYTRFVSAAESEFGQANTVLSSRGEQAQLRLGRQLRTNMFDEGTSGKLFDAIRDNLKDQLDATYTELRALKAVHAPAEKLAPLYSAIAKIEDDLDRQILDKFEKKWSDAVIPGRAAGAIGSARIGAITGTGNVYGPDMENAFRIQRGGAGALLSVAQAKYAAAVQQFGANSPQAIAAAVEVEQAKATVAQLPFQQINEKYSGLSQLAGSASNLSSGARQLILGEGRGSAAALPAVLGEIRSADTQIAIARAKLAEDTRAGAGPLIIASDREAIMRATIGRQQAGLGATDVQMPAPFEIEQLKARNKLQRMEQSFLEPGNMLDQYRILYGGAEKRLHAIDAQEAALKARGIAITPAMTARFEGQREQAKQEMFGYQVHMEEGWIDRLVSYSQGAPSFAMRARPTIAQAARALEDGQHDEHFRQARAFGFVSKRGYQYERERGFSTAGMSNMELFPGDLAQMALYGRRNEKVMFPRAGGKSDSGSGDFDPFTGAIGDLAEGGVQELIDSSNQTNALLQQLIQIIAGGGAPMAGGGRGPAPLGGVGYTEIVERLTDASRGDNRKPRQ